MSKWYYISNNHTDGVETTIDGWLTNNDDEEGKCLAVINNKTKEVEYKDIDAITDDYAQGKIREALTKLPDKYPEYIMKMLRQRLGLDKNDDSRDKEINTYWATEAFDECCEWEGLSGYSEFLIRLIEDCFNINLRKDN